LGISALQHFSDQSITPQLLKKKKKKVWKFFDHYLRPIPLDSSLLPHHFPPYHFSAKISDPAAPFSVHPFFHHYLRPIPLDSSIFPYHFYPYHFSAKKF
jgi:hypothetical protein